VTAFAYPRQRRGRRRPFLRKARAFVLGLGATGLGAVRSLGAVGISVTGVDWEPDAAGFKSRYCDAIRCADPAQEPEQVLDDLLSEGDKLDRPAVIIPTGD
jgi:threonine dehydrogenase-like Zn-dependent dehydrogenase